MCGYEPWKPLQVHHRTYERIGNEGLDDLIVVCPRCHMKIHGIQGRRKTERTLKSDVRKKNCRKRGILDGKFSEC